MYVPGQFQVTEPSLLHNFIDSQPLATLVVHDEAGLAADHIPLIRTTQPEGSIELLGHVARANPLALKAINGLECLAIFQGAQLYISPNGYATKAQHGKVVPTWNYEAVHVRGKLTAFEQPEQLRELLDRLTDRHESNQPKPWKTADAPSDYVDSLLRAIVGIKIEVTSVVGKAKLSQNQPVENQQSLIQSLSQSNDAAKKAMSQAISRGSFEKPQDS